MSEVYRDDLCQGILFTLKELLYPLENLPSFSDFPIYLPSAFIDVIMQHLNLIYKIQALFSNTGL